MKRKAMIFLFTIICCSAFSAGYRGTYWGEPMTELARQGLLFEMVQDERFVFMREEARVLGQPANIWYCLTNQKLVGICYTIEDTADSRAQIENLLNTKKLKLVKRKKVGYSEEQTKAFRKAIEEKSSNTTPYASLFVEDIINYNKGGGSLVSDLLSEENVEDSNVEVIKATYDHTTEVHILEGFLYGYIQVAYTEIPQDF